MRRSVLLLCMVLWVAGCGGGGARTTTTTTAAATTTTVVETTTTTPPPLTAADLTGVWNRESDEHGSEFIRFGADGTFAYADGTVENLDTADITGTFTIEDGVLHLDTGDCPGVPGLFTVRSYLIGAGVYLSFTASDDACLGRNEGMTFGPWASHP